MKEAISMFENCSNLLQCEAILAKRIDGVKLLGQLPFSASDLDKLDGLIAALAQYNVDNCVSFLVHRAPACLACFLVWHGIYDYKEGNYWSAIEGVTGELDAARQGRLGSAFLSFLRQRGLPIFDIEGSRPYVTSILIHGGIPIACLEEFFEHVVDDLIEHHMVEADIIALELAIRRDEHEERIKKEKQIKIQRQKISDLQHRLSYNQHRLDIAKRLLELLAEKERLADAACLPQDCRQRMEECRQEIEQQKLAMHKLQDRIDDLNEQIAAFTKTDMMVISHADDIEACKRYYDQWLFAQSSLTNDEIAINEHYEHLVQLWTAIFNCSLDEKHKSWLETFDMDQTLALLDKRDRLKQRIKEVSAAIWSKGRNAGIRRFNRIKNDYMFKQKEYRDVVNQLRQDFNGLPAAQFSPSNIDRVFVQSIGSVRNAYFQCISLKQKVEQQRQRLLQLQNYIQETAAGFDEGFVIDSKCRLEQWERRLAEAVEHSRIAQRASLELSEDNMPLQLERISLNITSLQQQLTQWSSCLTKLGEGDMEKGLSRLERYYTVNSEIEALQRQLGCMPDAGYIETLQASIEQDKCAIALLKEQLLSFEEDLGPLVFSYVSEPVRRFLLYGGDEAVRYLVDAVNLAKMAYAAGKIYNCSYDRLPAHIVEAFKLWFYNRKCWETQKSARVVGNKFISPYIKLSNDLDEITICMPKQRLVLTADIMERLQGGRIYIIIQGGNKRERLELLGRRCGAFEIEIDESYLMLPFVSDIYKVELCIADNVIYRWKMAGMDEHSPCFAFDSHSGKLLQKIPKAVVWLLLRKGYHLERSQNINIIYQAAFYGLDGKWLLQMVDLSRCESNIIAILDESNAVRYYSLYSNNADNPVLVGHTGNCFINDTPVYEDGPPSLQLPSSIIGEAVYWRFSLWALDDKNFVPIHRRLSDLMTAMQKEDGDTWLLPFDTPGFLDDVAAGRFIANMAGPRGKEYALEFGVLPKVEFYFENDIYIPHLHTNEKAKLLIYLSEDEEIEFLPQQPAFLEEKDEDFAIAVCDAKQPSIAGALCYKSRENLVIDINITIPRFVWFIKDREAGSIASWENANSPLFIGLWEKYSSLSLDIKLPWNVNGDAVLSLKDGDIVLQSHRTIVSQGIASLDLMRFYDTLRGCGNAAEFMLTIVTLEGPLLKDVPLFKVYTLWQVEALRYTWLYDEQGIKLRLEWTDLGRQTDRAVQLWPLWQPQASPIIKSIPDDCSYVEFDANDGITHDRYLCRFYVEDKWMQSDAYINWPSLEEANVFEVLPQDECIISDISMSWDSGGHMLTILGQARLQIIHKGKMINIFAVGMQEGMPICEVTEADITNDGRFKGQLYIDKPYCRWVIIAVAQEPAVYAVFIVPQIEATNYFADTATLEMLEPIWDYMQPDVKVRMDDDPSSPLFFTKPKNGGRFDVSFISQLSMGNRVEARICLEHLDKLCRLSYKPEHGFYIELQSGVQCTSCGKLLPAQDEWDRTHFPKCKSFKVMYNDKLRADLFFVWNCKYVIERLIQPLKHKRWFQSNVYRLPIGFNDVNKLTFLLSCVENKKPQEINNLVRLLMNKELAHILRIKSLIEGGVVHAH